MELKPGTPEYQAEYEKEMKRLEAEAGDDKAKAKSEAAVTTSEADDEAAKAAAKKAEAASTETVEELKARLEKAEKAIKDNQAWGTRNAQEVARLKKEAEEAKRAATRPAILDANPGLEDAIKHVSQPVETRKVPEEWLSTVSRAIPDVEQLLGDKDFYARAAAKKAEFGPDWDDPITAIRELSSIRTEHLNQKSVQVAVEAARKDFEAKAKKRSAMEVPGGSGGKDPAKGDDAADRYRTMSKADFDKERSRVMGY